MNKIKVNTYKSYHIVFSYRNKSLLPPTRLGREIIAQTEKKILGIILDVSLSFKARINEFRNKLSRLVGISYRLNSFFPEEILKSLYYTLFHPYIYFNIKSWFGASEYMLEKVRIIQRKSLRAIFSLPYNDLTNSFFKNNLILKLDELYMFTILKIIFALNTEDFFSILIIFFLIFQPLILSISIMFQ